MAQLVNNPPAMWETRVRSLGWEDPLEKEKATNSSVLAWRIPWTISFPTRKLIFFKPSWADEKFSRVFDQSMLLLRRFSRVRLCVTP